VILTSIAVALVEIGVDAESLILISSNAGLKGLPFTGPYVAAKHGVVGIMRMLANELGSKNVRVNSVHPTGVHTPMLDGLGRMSELIESEPSVGPIFTNSLSIQGVEPEDISDAVLFLASDHAKYITGLTMTVDAGASIH
jgi:NAD(P)-dependent dehydrogenase (short-subunit alcohol dehydrogenase family)